MSEPIEIFRKLWAILTMIESCQSLMRTHNKINDKVNSRFRTKES